MSAVLVTAAVQVLLPLVADALGRGVDAFGALPVAEQQARVRAVLTSGIVRASGAGGFLAAQAAKSGATVSWIASALAKHGRAAVAVGASAATSRLSASPRGPPMTKLLAAPGVPPITLDRLDVTRARRLGVAPYRGVGGVPATVRTNSGKQTVVVAWVSPGGSKVVPKTATWSIPQYEDTLKASSVMWANEGGPAEVAAAKAYARTQKVGDTVWMGVFVYPMSEPEPLKRARAEAMLKVPKGKRTNGGAGATATAIRALGLKVTRTDGEYRVAYKCLSKAREEATAAYTSDAADALGTAQAMAERVAAMEARASLRARRGAMTRPPRRNCGGDCGCAACSARTNPRRNGTDWAVVGALGLPGGEWYVRMMEGAKIRKISAKTAAAWIAEHPHALSPREAEGLKYAVLFYVPAPYVQHGEGKGRVEGGWIKPAWAWDAGILLRPGDATVKTNPRPRRNGPKASTRAFHQEHGGYGISHTRKLAHPGYRDTAGHPEGAPFDVRVGTRSFDTLGGAQAWIEDQNTARMAPTPPRRNHHLRAGDRVQMKGGAGYGLGTGTVTREVDPAADIYAVRWEGRDRPMRVDGALLVKVLRNPAYEPGRKVLVSLAKMYRGKVATEYDPGWGYRATFPDARMREAFERHAGKMSVVRLRSLSGPQAETAVYAEPADGQGGFG